MSISTLLAYASQKIDRFDAELILAHILKQSREFFITHGNDPVRFFDMLHFLYLVNKRKQHIPLAYLTGEKEFFGLQFYVNKHTLVPRPDTEVLVEAAIDAMKKNPDALLLDIGTGSGCIPIAVIKNINTKTVAFATDISAKALIVAKKNAARHAIPITFLQGNLLEPFFLHTITNKPLILTANLPYLTRQQFLGEATIQAEPKSALVADDNGLALYKQLIIQLKNIKDRPLTCFFEIDPSQTELLRSYIQEQFPSAVVSTRQDYTGTDRFIEWTVQQ